MELRLKTGVELITEIANCSEYIENHPMGMNVQRAFERRKLLRKELAEFPDLTFS